MYYSFTMTNDALIRTTESYCIVLAKKDLLVAELTRLARRAKRLGAPEITWSFGEIVTREVRVRRQDVTDEEAAILPGAMTHQTRAVPFIQMTLTGAVPRIAGWTFAATLQHVDGVNIMRNVPGLGRDVPETYRTVGARCDHCQLARDRRDTYLVVNGDTWKQVGSSCLADFTGGHGDPHAIAAYAELLASAAQLCGGAEGDEEGGYGFGGGRHVFALIAYLECVAAEIRERGWVPKSRVDNPANSTAMMAEDRLCPAKGSKRRDRSVTDADKKIAEVAMEWAIQLGDGKTRLNDYLWNVHAVAKSGIVEGRTFGIAASIIAAYTKAEAAKNASPSQHVGDIGERRSFALTLVRHFSFETMFGLMTRFIFHDDDGNVFTWKTAAGDSDLTEGERYTVRGTMKDHSEYKGVPQNVLSRCETAPHDPVAFERARSAEFRKALTKKAKSGALSEAEQAQLDALRRPTRPKTPRTTVQEEMAR